MVQQQITSVYPVTNGIHDEVPRILNRAFIPRGVKCYDTPMVVMWTRLGAHGGGLVTQQLCTCLVASDSCNRDD